MAVLLSQFASRSTSVTVERYISICCCKLVGHCRRFSYFFTPEPKRPSCWLEGSLWQ